MDDAKAYAQETWGDVELNDARLTRRAVVALATVAASPGASFVEACRGNAALQERLYRLIRDKGTQLEALIDAGCRSVARRAAQDCAQDIAVVGDTTSYGFRHGGAAALGDLGGKAESKRRGFFSHVALAVDAARGTVVGPLDLDLGIRPLRDPAQPRDHKQLPYEQKESFKWEASVESVDERAAAIRHRLVFINDREADVLEYLMALIGSALRFVVRSSWDRLLEDGVRLRAKLEARPVQGRVRVHIDQKGGRPARDAVLELRSAPIVLAGRRSDALFPRLELNAVWLTEAEPPEGSSAVDWLLLTSEPIEEVAQVMEVVRLYCLRWLVEEYNKCCKSDGTAIEDLRMRKPEHLLRAAVLCMFAAVPMMRLRAELLEKDSRARWPVWLDAEAPTTPPSPRPSPRACTQALSVVQWVTLWQAIERGQAVPIEPPTCAWALKALAQLGGWGDTKRTGRPGYPALWKGWERLLDRVEAITLALEASQPRGSMEM